MRKYEKEYAYIRTYVKIESVVHAWRMSESNMCAGHVHGGIFFFKKKKNLIIVFLDNPL